MNAPHPRAGDVVQEVRATADIAVAHATDAPLTPNAALCHAEALLSRALQAVRQGDVVRALENTTWAAAGLANAIAEDRGAL